MSKFVPDQLMVGQFLTSCVRTLALTTTTAFTSSDLSFGTYVVTSDTDCTFTQGASNVIATSVSGSNGTCETVLWARSYSPPMLVNSTSTARIAAIAFSGTGTLYIQRIQ